MAGCEVLYSEDMNSGQTYEGVRVDNPFVHPDINLTEEQSKEQMDLEHLS